MTDLPFQPLMTLRQAIAQRKLSAKDLVRTCLDRIEKLNPVLNAFREVFADQALQQAEKVDAGHITGPLAGIPIAIKDNLCTDYGLTTCSSKILGNFRSPYTATAVRRLQEAGAIILGKTNMDEFAMGSSNETCAWGPVRNPWDTHRVPGGSSGGSAVAVAAGLCPAALGSDTGGSIRLPAAFCGVLGIKPTYGRVSRFGLVAYASSLDQIGCFTRWASDAALILNIISGHDPKDSTSAPHPVPDYTAELHQPLTSLRIGLAREYLSDANDPAVQQALSQAIDIFRAAGVQIVEVSLPHTRFGIPTYYIVATAEASSNLARYDGVRYGYRSPHARDLWELYCLSRAEGFGPEVQRRIMLGTFVLSSGYYEAYYLRALKVRRLIKRDFDQAFHHCQAILCPTATGPAFRLGEKIDDPLTMYLNDVYTVTANLAGLPALSFPAGFAQVDSHLLPIGLQLLGPLFQESLLLRLVHHFQSRTHYHCQSPPAPSAAPAST